MAVTLTDVANALGLSASTVSRALSMPEKVNAQTRERIQQTVHQMGYVPNQVARSLTSGRMDTLAIIVPDIANPFFPPIIKAVQARAARRGMTVLLSDVDEHAVDEIDRARNLAKRVDGLIMVSPRTASAHLAGLRDIPNIVFVNREVEGASFVLIDDGDGMVQAVEHLHALGHRNIAYLNGPKRSWSNVLRQSAIESACARLGMTLSEFGPFEAQIQAGARAADLVYASAVTAVIAYDDLIALGVMARLTERGLRIGRDMSVIGVDDSPMSGMAYPTLTSVHVPGAEVGVAAVDIILEQLSTPGKHEPQIVELETHLIVRSSTSVPHPRDGSVAV